MARKPYRSPRRAEQAQATRNAILDAAHALFFDNGYAATSIKAVAEAANVSAQTIYNVFGDKPSLLFEVGVRVVRGAPDRDLAAELRAASNSTERIGIVAAWIRMVWEGGMLEFETMLLDAAASDPRAKAVADAAWKQKYEENAKLFTLAFPDCEPSKDALDLMFALDSAAFARILIEDRGWSYDRYQHYLADTLERLFSTSLRPIS